MKTQLLASGMAMLVSPLLTFGQSALSQSPPDLRREAPPLGAELTVTVSSHTPGGSLQQTQTGKYWRDRDGRTRQDWSFGSVISDPQTRTVIRLNHVNREAIIVRLPPVPSTQSSAPAGESDGVVPLTSPAPGGPTHSEGDLGERIIEGFRALGTRRTIEGVPPLQIGSATIEVWTAPDLRIPIYVKQGSSAGVSIQEFRNIELADPDPSLFSIPSGYIIKEMPLGGE